MSTKRTPSFWINFYMQMKEFRNLVSDKEYEIKNLVKRIEVINRYLKRRLSGLQYCTKKNDTMSTNTGHFDYDSRSRLDNKKDDKDDQETCTSLLERIEVQDTTCEQNIVCHATVSTSSSKKTSQPTEKIQELSRALSPYELTSLTERDLPYIQERTALLQKLIHVHKERDQFERELRILELKKQEFQGRRIAKRRMQENKTYHDLQAYGPLYQPTTLTLRCHFEKGPTKMADKKTWTIVNKDQDNATKPSGWGHGNIDTPTGSCSDFFHRSGHWKGPNDMPNEQWEKTVKLDYPKATQMPDEAWEKQVKL